MTDIAADERLKLNDCDREPIHVPEAIQPHGLLFVVCVNKPNKLP